MIDTDKYEGHTPVRKEWPRWCEDWLFTLYSGETEDGSHTPAWNQDNALACDAPALLAEVKRLREDNELYLACIHASQFKDKPGSAMSMLNQLLFLQRSEEE